MSYLCIDKLVRTLKDRGRHDVDIAAARQRRSNPIAHVGLHSGPIRLQPRAIGEKIAEGPSVQLHS